MPIYNLTHPNKRSSTLPPRPPPPTIPTPHPHTPPCASPRPIIHPPPLDKALPIPNHPRQRLASPDLQNRQRRRPALPIQKPHILIQNQVRLRHQTVRLRHERRLPPVPLAEPADLLVGDPEPAHVPQRGGGVVLAHDEQHREALPAEGPQRCERRQSCPRRG